MYKNLGGFNPPGDKKLISNAYCIGNIVGFYNSNELNIPLSIPYLIRDEDDELPSSGCSSFGGPEAIFRNYSLIPCLPSPSDQKEGYVMSIGSVKNALIGSFECSGMFCSIYLYQIE